MCQDARTRNLDKGIMDASAGVLLQFDVYDGGIGTVTGR